MNAQAFTIVFADYFSIDDFKYLFSDLGIVKEVKVQEAMSGRIRGYTYNIHMESWTKTGEYFRNDVLESGSVRYCYDDDGCRPLYFICEPIP